MYTMLVSAEQLRQGLKAQEPWLIFDVRHDLADHDAGRRNYEEGHIPGALYLDHERQLSAPRTGRNGRHPLPALRDFAGLMRTQGLAPGTQVAVYDASGGMFAAHLWWMLRWLGHEKAAVLDGGWQAWLQAGGEAQRGPNTAPGRDRGALDPAPGMPQADAGGASLPEGGACVPAMPTVDADTVLANIGQPVFKVVDARAPERFRGETEPMDPVAGHIPGALNRPNSLNLAPDGRFKPAAQLRGEFTALLGDTAPGQVVHQCGSGITASHNLFAMELADLRGSVLYPGSWSEWCSDPARPVATGG